MRRTHRQLAAIAAPIFVLALALGACSKPPAPEPREKELVTEEVYESEVDLSGDVSEEAPDEVDLEEMGLVLPADEDEDEDKDEGGGENQN